MKTKAPEARKDYTDYNSPFIRLDGTRPYNSHLWPTESWRHEDFHRFWFSIVALKDGRCATDGSLWCLENNSTLAKWEEERTGKKGRPVIFATRTEAIRTAGARAIIEARWSKKWGRSHGLTAGEIETFANWVLETVNTATSGDGWRPVKTIPEPPPPPKDETAGLDLFDFNKPQGDTTP